MLIKEVESVVGLSKKSIRYYEQVGLLNPKRQIRMIIEIILKMISYF